MGIPSSLRLVRAAPFIAWYRIRGRRPRDYQGQWETYWSRSRVGAGDNDVLWDPDDETEVAEAADALSEQAADPALPLIDLGCGNGRRSAYLASRFDRVIGVDVSAAAVELARSAANVSSDGDGDGGDGGDDTSEGGAGLSFQVLDGLDTEAVEALAAQTGPANIHMRGVIHVIHERDRESFLANLERLLGDRGTLYQIETDGEALRYFLEHPEDSPSGLPRLMHRVVQAGILPHGFGPADCDRWYRDRGWTVLDSRPSVLRVQDLAGEPGRVPAHVAVVRPPGFRDA